MKFTKKPVTIDAFKWTGDQNQLEDPEWIVEAIKNGKVSFTTPSPTDEVKLQVHTPEGVMTADVGDYIIRGVKGEIYPCKTDIFMLTYEPEYEVVVKGVEGKVFPSEEHTITVALDKDYGGAHRYFFNNCLGFNNGKTEYAKEGQSIQFVQKNEDGSMTPGLQSEQLVLALIDRQEKLNARFPSPFSDKALAGLRMFLEAQKERVEDRIARGVMGDLKK